MAYGRKYGKGSDRSSGGRGSVGQQSVRKTEKSLRRSEMTADEASAAQEKLYADISKLDTDYVSYVAKTADFRLPQSQQQQQTSAMAKFYNYQMFNFCMMPLAQGLQPGTVSTVATRFGTMYMCSSNFRGMFKDYLQNNKDRAAEKKLDKYDAWVAKHQRSLSPKHQKEYDTLVSQLNHGVEPLSPKTTALTHVGFAKKAYEDMRKPGADINAINQQYRGAVNNLYTQAKKDGCSVNECKRNFRLAVGIESKKDPSVAAMFDETCYGGYEMVSRTEREMTMSDDGPSVKTYEVFDGDYVAPDGTLCDDVFTLRLPESSDAHVERFSTALTDALDVEDGAEAARRVHDLSVKKDEVWAAALADDCPSKARRDEALKSMHGAPANVVANLQKASEYLNGFLDETEKMAGGTKGEPLKGRVAAKARQERQYRKNRDIYATYDFDDPKPSDGDDFEI